MTFGELIRQKREEQKLSLFDLALKTQMRPQTISAIETRGLCLLSSAMKLAKALGLEHIPLM